MDVLLENEAVELLRSVTAEFRANDSVEDLAELTGLCARLPLALRIAAERAAARPRMPLADLIQDLRDESALWDALSTEGDDSDGVRTVFAWSYRALPADAARLFRLLGLHPGPEFSIDAAGATAHMVATKVRQPLDSLVGVHMLEQIAPDRYRFHDLLHAYAIDQAHRDETLYDQHVTTQRVLAWYLHTANATAHAFAYNPQPVQLDPHDEDIQPLTFDGHNAALRWCDAEQSNIVEAARIAARVRLDGVAWRLHAVLREYYAYRCLYSNWFTTGRIALEAVRRQSDRNGEAIILESLGKAYRQTGRLAEAEEHHHDALRVRRELGERAGEARSLNAIGLISRERGDLEPARDRFEQATALAEEIDHGHWSLVARANLGETLVQSGDLARATEILHRALDDARRLGNTYFEYECLQSLSRAQRESDPGLAVESIEQAVAICRALEDTPLEGLALTEHGHALLAAGRSGDALTSFQRAATIHRQFGYRSREASALLGTGNVYAALGQYDEAGGFLHRTVVMLRDLENPRTLAMALIDYADVLRRTGEAESARELWEEALPLLAERSDPRASHLHTLVTQRLTTENDGGRSRLPGGRPGHDQYVPGK